MRALAVFLFIFIPSLGHAQSEDAKEGNNKSLVGDAVITSDPTGAIIYLDEKIAGATPLKIEHIAAGIHQIRLIHPQCEIYESQITVLAGKSITHHAKLIPKKQSKKKSPKDSGKPYRISGWTLAGIAAAGLATSGVFYYQALGYSETSRSADSVDECKTARSRGKDALVISYVSGGIGLASGAGSGILLYKGYAYSIMSSESLGNFGAAIQIDDSQVDLKVGFYW
jgi:hypothetical protein